MHLVQAAISRQREQKETAAEQGFGLGLVMLRGLGQPEPVCDAVESKRCSIKRSRPTSTVPAPGCCWHLLTQVLRPRLLSLRQVANVSLTAPSLDTSDSQLQNLPGSFSVSHHGIYSTSSQGKKKWAGGCQQSTLHTQEWFMFCGGHGMKSAVTCWADS